MPDPKARKDTDFDWPEVQLCACGAPMTFVSIELGYSCTNPECVMHVDTQCYFTIDTRAIECDECGRLFFPEVLIQEQCSHHCFLTSQGIGPDE